MTDETLKAALEALRARITRIFPEQIHAAVEGLTEDELWWRPNEQSNSIANILIHLTGSLNHYLNRNLGGMEFTRDRPAEFADRSGASKSTLLEAFDQMVARAEQTFAALDVSKLGAASPEPSMHKFVIEDLINIAVHLSNHAGQIVWIAKLLHADAVDEIWTRSHKSGGAWRR